MKLFFEIGPTPYNEDCLQVGSASVWAMQEETQRYVDALIKYFKPKHVKIAVKGFPHDFGYYYEAVVWFDEDDEAAIKEATWIENNLPGTWKEMEPHEVKLEELIRLDKGKRVLYLKEHEYGIITDWNDKYIFVQYDGDSHSKATMPGDLTWA